MFKQGYVYILASRRNGTLYTGVSSELAQRVGEHKEDVQEGFTKRYEESYGWIPAQAGIHP